MILCFEQVLFLIKSLLLKRDYQKKVTKCFNFYYLSSNLCDFLKGLRKDHILTHQESIPDKKCDRCHVYLQPHKCNFLSDHCLREKSSNCFQFYELKEVMVSILNFKF